MTAAALNELGDRGPALAALIDRARAAVPFYAEHLAERLTLRDRQHDDRRLCLECAALADNRRCLVAARGLLAGADRRLEPVPTILQRCDGFALAPGLT